MWHAIGHESPDSEWEAACTADLERRLADESLAVGFVIDRDPAAPGELAASGIGLVRYELPSPGRVDGRSGYILSVCTADEFRGRGYATSIMRALMQWFDERGVTKLELHASPFGVEIYRRLGFVEPRGAALTWSRPS